MVSRLKKLMTILPLVALTGCSHLYGKHSFLQNRDTDYLRARSIPPLVIPPGLSSSTIQAHYPVTARDYPESARSISLLPPDLETSANMPVQRRPAPEPIQPIETAAAKPMPVATPTTAAAAQTPTAAAPANYYYDGFTRSSSPNKAGRPLASFVAPKKPGAINTAPATGKEAPAARQQTSDATPPQQQSGGFGSMMSSITSAMPWSNSKKAAPATKEQQIQEANNAKTEQDIKKQYYFDHFTRN